MTPTDPIDPELYALVHDGAPGDVAFYLRHSEPSQRVLELGSGFGRVAEALARERRVVVGLELDPVMIALAERRRAELDRETAARVRYVQGDMAEIRARRELRPRHRAVQRALLPAR